MKKLIISTAVALGLVFGGASSAQAYNPPGSCSTYPVCAGDKWNKPSYDWRGCRITSIPKRPGVKVTVRASLVAQYCGAYGNKRTVRR